MGARRQIRTNQTVYRTVVTALYCGVCSSTVGCYVEWVGSWRTNAKTNIVEEVSLANLVDDAETSFFCVTIGTGVNTGTVIHHQIVACVAREALYFKRIIEAFVNFQSSQFL